MKRCDNGNQGAARRAGKVRGRLKLLFAVLAAGVTLGLLLPGIRRVRETTGHPRCSSNLRQIALACHLYADDNDMCFPDSLYRLVPEYIDNPRVFRCPSARACQAGDDPSQPSDPAGSYTLVPGMRETMPADTILLHDSSVQNHQGAGRHVAYVDGRVEWLREDEFARRLAEQRARLAGEGQSPSGPGAAP